MVTILGASWKDVHGFIEASDHAVVSVAIIPCASTILASLRLMCCAPIAFAFRVIVDGNNILSPGVSAAAKGKLQKQLGQKARSWRTTHG